MPKYCKSLTKKICDIIAEDDYTVEEICLQVGISEAIYYKWKVDHLEFLEAIKKAGEKRLEVFRKSARSGLLTLLKGKEFEETTTEYVDDKGGKPKIKSKKIVKKFILPNPTSVIFALKNLDPDNFQDLIKQEHSGAMDFRTFLMRNNRTADDGE